MRHSGKARRKVRSADGAKIPLFVLMFSISTFLLDTGYKIRAQHLSENNFKCSHRPLTELQTPKFVRLNADFITAPDDFLAPDQSRSVEMPNHSDRSIELINSRTADAKAQRRRHISSQGNLLPGDDASESPQSSVWSFFKRFGSAAILKDEEVPMKIQVHYDESVYALEAPKRDLIVHKVIPGVVEFFESALSLRRNSAMERFRISRRCPNNTVYHIRDSAGMFRTYCMERCENYAICGEMVVPASHLSACSYCNSTSKRCSIDAASEGPGVENAQLLLYVSSKQTMRCKKDQTIAYAAHCALDAKTDRPVAGHANLCPSSISTEPKDLRSLISTVKHELTHVLGFSVSLFAYYRDSLGRPLTERGSSPGPIPVDPKTGYARWSDKVIRKVVRTDWLTGGGRVDKEIHVMVTPTVVREVRNHFNCSSLEGAELEDQGSDGTSMTHLEKRLFENEAMTGTHTQNSIYSRISLAVLQDTGWYIANFSIAERLEWGQGLGCDFAMKSCKSWIDERRLKRLSIRPYCDRVKSELLQMACTEDRISKAVCNIKQFKEQLPPFYQNFDQLDGVPNEALAHYGGSVDLADYCPFIQEFTWLTSNISSRGSRCDQVGASIEPERNAALESFGPQARCFEHGRRWEQRSCIYKRSWHHFGAGCYKFSCKDGHFSVLIGNHSYHCYYPNQNLRIEQIVDHWLYNGTLTCPACDKICAPHSCKSFDRKFIDKILDIRSDRSQLSPGNDSIETIFGEFDESINLIDPTQDLEEPKQYKESLDYKTKFKDLWLMISQHKKPPQHSLACSSGISSLAIQHLSYISIVLVASILVSQLTSSINTIPPWTRISLIHL